MRSGIGPAAHLLNLDISVLEDSPGRLPVTGSSSRVCDLRFEGGFEAMRMNIKTHGVSNAQGDSSGLWPGRPENGLSAGAVPSSFNRSTLPLGVSSFFSSRKAEMFSVRVGKLVGRHQIAPELSPSKTREGLVRGFVCATALALEM
jgi:hypothetical protein